MTVLSVSKIYLAAPLDVYAKVPLAKKTAGSLSAHYKWSMDYRDESAIDDKD